MVTTFIFTLQIMKILRVQIDVWEVLLLVIIVGFIRDLGNDESKVFKVGNEVNKKDSVSMNFQKMVDFDFFKIKALLSSGKINVTGIKMGQAICLKNI